MKNLIVIILFCLLTSCSNYGQLTYITKLPKKLEENSGIAFQKDTTLWVILDKGNPDKLYLTDFDGNLLNQLKVTNGKNEDWEDITQDKKGNLYIADTGNNHGKRKELVIYKVAPKTVKEDKVEAEKIRFTYPNHQTHDSEAMFYRNNHLYIITKDRGRPFTGEAMIYKIPAQSGSHTATLAGKFTPCSQQGLCEVTAADISPDGRTVAVLGYGKLWLFTNFNSDDFTQGNMKTIELGATTQLEALCFMDEGTLLLSDEERGKTGRNLYSFSLSE